MNSERERENERERRWWLILLLILLLGILAMCCAGQMALGMVPSWTVPANMDSKIDPDKKYSSSVGTQVIFEPIEEGILTQPSWANDILTPPTHVPTHATGNPSTTGTPQVPTATLAGGTVTSTLPVTVTVTTPQTETSTPLPTNTFIVVPPIYTATNTPHPPAPTGTIRIVKDSQPNSGQDFTFSGGLGTFSLDDDADATLSNTRTASSLAVGSYTVTEAAAAGWSLTGLVCADPDGGTTVNLGARSAIIDLDANETITCTFTNQQQGSITIIEDSQPDSAQIFPYSGSLGAFNLVDDGSPTSTRTFAGLAAGTYTVTQTNMVGAGWDLTTVVCVDPDGGTTTNVGTLTATIDLDVSESITCTFTNLRRGSITVVKDSQPNNSQDFTFTGSGMLGSFSLDDDADATLSNTVTLPGIPSGTYTITEAAVAGWNLTDITCVDPDSGSAGNIGTGTATIDLDPGDNITCTFTNNMLGSSITIVENSVPDSSLDIDYSGDLGIFSLDDDTDGTLSNTVTFNSLAPGTYNVSQATYVNWTLTGLSCIDPSGGTTTNLGALTATIDLAAGENITCTFTNSLDAYAPVAPPAGVNQGNWDGAYLNFPPPASALTFSLTPPITTGAGPDLVFYEHYLPGPPRIQLDQIVIEISPDNVNWFQVFFWGDGAPDTNTNVSGLDPGVESDNFTIASGLLYNSAGITIDIDGILPPGSYPYIRLTDPGTGDGADVDAVQTLH